MSGNDRCNLPPIDHLAHKSVGIASVRDVPHGADRDAMPRIEVRTAVIKSRLERI